VLDFIGLKMRGKVKKIKEWYNWGGRFLTNEYQLKVKKKTENEIKKSPSRTEVLNYLLSLTEGDAKYLEIGVRNPNDNFNHINSKNKFSVDPGVEFDENPVDFKMTSDCFFESLRKKELNEVPERFDVIFIDGLHLAEQVERDINNALDFISDKGFVVLHDCNPPSEWHAREEYYYDLSPAGRYWNGTTWKALYKNRMNKEVSCACIDTDWGVGVITRQKKFTHLEDDINPYFEYKVLDRNRSNSLNLMSFENFKKSFS
jgi:hypothetical protein